MPVPTRTNIAHYRGDSLAIQVTLWTDQAHTIPADLAGATVRSQIREDRDDTALVAELATSVAGNVINAYLSPASSRTLPPLGFWDVEVDWFSDDVTVQTVAAGGISSEPDVTRAVA